LSRSPAFRLLAITPPIGAVDASIVAAWSEAGAGEHGIAVLLREPGRRGSEILAPDGRLSGLRRLCDRHGVRVLLACDQADLDDGVRALNTCGLQGLQVRGDPGLQVLRFARERLGDGILGRSCHGEPQPGHDIVDYTCFAPVFEPRTRDHGVPKEAAGVETLARWTADQDADIFALGGIGPEEARACLAAGTFGLAGITTSFGEHAKVAHDVAKLCAELARAKSSHGAKEA
jgi:thiamine monophosphate synthase